MKSENIDIDALRCGSTSFVEQPRKENEDACILRAALARMDGGAKWCKGQLGDGDSVCARGAINWVRHGSAQWSDADKRTIGYPRAMELLDEAARMLWPDLKVGWADWASVMVNNTRPFADVRAMFEKAILLAATPS